MKLHIFPAGSVSVVIMDQHRGVYAHSAPTPEDLWAWMRATDPDAGLATAFSMTSLDWIAVTHNLSTHHTVYVETEFDCDLVVTRHDL